MPQAWKNELFVDVGKPTRSLRIVCYQPQGWSTCAAGPGGGRHLAFLETSVHVQPETFGPQDF